MGRAPHRIERLYCKRCEAPINDWLLCTWQCEHDGVPVSERPPDKVEWRSFILERAGAKRPAIDATFIIADAFAELLARETGSGVDDWPEHQVAKVETALKEIGRTIAAERLRKAWSLHRRDR